MWHQRNSLVLVMIVAAVPRVSGGAREPDVTVCMNPGGNASAVLRAEAMATQIYGSIGVTLVWRAPSSKCVSPYVLIALSERTLDGERPGALAYAQPFDGGSVVVFHDRVRKFVWPALTESLLAHVLVHEIAHVLQGLDIHSATGMMKSRWDYGDYKEMDRGGLAFTPEDIEMIWRGLELRIARKPPSNSSVGLAGGDL